MIRMNSFWTLSLLALCSILPGCGNGDATSSGHDHDHAEHAEEEHAGHDHAEEGHGQEEASGADFEEGAGIRLAEPAREVIGLETTEVTRKELALEFTATARVFHAAHQHGTEFPGHKDGYAYAHAIIPAEKADLLTIGQTVPVQPQGMARGDEPYTGRLSGINRETAKAIGQIEAVIEVPDPEERLEFGAFLTARFAGPAKAATVIPLSAVVDAATGTFAYVQNSDRWLRAPIEVGRENQDFAEILGGLFEGDVVVSQGAIDLWLIELRFTKGGGHSH